jgi:hypothetical protein
MAEPTDPRIIDMMRQKARNERPLPKDFQELMEKTLEGDPASIRLVQESFSTEGMTAQEYASDWLGRNQSTPEDYSKGRIPTPMPSERDPYLEGRIPTPMPLSDPSGMIVNPEKVEDEMTKILKSLLKASEQKAKEEKQ